MVNAIQTFTLVAIKKSLNFTDIVLVCASLICYSLNILSGTMKTLLPHVHHVLWQYVLPPCFNSLFCPYLHFKNIIVSCSLVLCYRYPTFYLSLNLFKALTLWAYAFDKSKCLCVCLFVCLFVCSFFRDTV